MLGATLLYKTGHVHLVAARWSEDSVFCLEVGSHVILDAKEYWSAEEFARSVRPDQASMNSLRELVTQEANLHLCNNLSNDEILRLTAILLAQGRLRAVFCSNTMIGPAHSVAPGFDVLRFHVQLGLGPSACPFCLGHQVRKWTDSEATADFVQSLFELKDVAPRLRHLASIAGEAASDRDEVMRKRLEHLLTTGRLVVIECPLGDWPVLRDDSEDEAEKARRAQQARQLQQALAKKPDQRPSKTWIEIRLLDKQGKPVPNRNYRVMLPDRSTVEGTLDANGRARLEEIDPGSCQVSFLDIDGREWHPA